MSKKCASLLLLGCLLALALPGVMAQSASDNATNVTATAELTTDVICDLFLNFWYGADNDESNYTKLFHPSCQCYGNSQIGFHVECQDLCQSCQNVTTQEGVEGEDETTTVCGYYSVQSARVVVNDDELTDFGLRMGRDDYDNIWAYYVKSCADDGTTRVCKFAQFAGDNIQSFSVNGEECTWTSYWYERECQWTTSCANVGYGQLMSSCERDTIEGLFNLHYWNNFIDESNVGVCNGYAADGGGNYTDSPGTEEEDSVVAEEAVTRNINLEAEPKEEEGNVENQLPSGAHQRAIYSSLASLFAACSIL